jgi:Helix-turn-helix domain
MSARQDYLRAVESTGTPIEDRDDTLPEWVYGVLTVEQTEGEMRRPLFLWRRLIEGTDLPGTVRHVALTLAERCNDRQLYCWPSEARLSTLTGWSESAVRRALQELKTRGFVEVQVRRKDCRRNDTNVYTPQWPDRYVWAAEIEALRGARRPRRPQVTQTPRVVTQTPSGVHTDLRPQVTVTMEGVTEGVTEGVSEAREAPLRARRGQPQGPHREGQGQETAGEGQGQEQRQETVGEAAHPRPGRERPWGSPSPKGQGPALRRCPVCGTPYILDDRNRLVPDCDCPIPTSDAFLANYTGQAADEKRA